MHVLLLLCKYGVTQLTVILRTVSHTRFNNILCLISQPSDLEVYIFKEYIPRMLLKDDMT